MTVPNRVGAALASEHSTLPGTDPYQFGRIIGEIAVRNDALPLDATPDFAKIPNSRDYTSPSGTNHPRSALGTQ